MSNPSNGEVAMAEAIQAVALPPVKPAPPQPRIVVPIPIQLDKERHLVMNLRAMKRIKDLTGLIMWESNAWDIQDPEHLAQVLWACLLHEDPTLSVDDVMDMPGADIANITYISFKLNQLWGTSMPVADESQPVDATGPNENSSSSSSGQSEDTTSVSRKKSSGT